MELRLVIELPDQGFSASAVIHEDAATSLQDSTFLEITSHTSLCH